MVYWLNNSVSSERWVLLNQYSRSTRVCPRGFSQLNRTGQHFPMYCVNMKEFSWCFQNTCIVKYALHCVLGLKKIYRNLCKQITSTFSVFYEFYFFIQMFSTNTNFDGDVFIHYFRKCIIYEVKTSDLRSWICIIFKAAMLHSADIQCICQHQRHLGKVNASCF